MTAKILGLIGLAIGGYLIGGVFGAKIFSRAKGGDISKMDSGNPGAMNMARNYGVWLAAATLLFDAIKAAICALIGWFIFGDLGLYIGGFAVVVGHMFPIYYKFKGGKGVSSSFGVLAVANPIVGIPLFVLTLVMICITKQGALCDLGYLLVMGIVESIMCDGTYIAVYFIIWAIVILVFWRHRSNILRVVKGTENKTELGKEIKKAFTHKKKEDTATNIQQPQEDTSSKVEVKEAEQKGIGKEE